MVHVDGDCRYGNESSLEPASASVHQDTMRETLSHSDAPHSSVTRNADEIFQYLKLAVDGNPLNAIEAPSNVSASNDGIDRIVSNIGVNGKCTTMG